MDTDDFRAKHKQMRLILSSEKAIKLISMVNDCRYECLEKAWL